MKNEKNLSVASKHLLEKWRELTRTGKRNTIEYTEISKIIKKGKYRMLENSWEIRQQKGIG